MKVLSFVFGNSCYFRNRITGSEGWIYALDFRREELAIRDLVKIMKKDKNEEIAKCFDTYMEIWRITRKSFGLPLTRPLCSGQM